MKEFNELLEISESILKLMKYIEKNDEDIYKGLLEDLLLKENEKIQSLVNDKDKFKQVLAFGTKKYKWDFNFVFLSNFVENELMSYSLLRVFNLLTQADNFFMIQSFTSLTPKELNIVLTNPFFAQLKMKVMCNKKLSNCAYHNYLKLSNKDTLEYRYISTFLDQNEINLENYRVLDLELNKSNLSFYDIETFYQHFLLEPLFENIDCKKLMIFRAYLIGIPREYISTVWQKLQKVFEEVKGSHYNKKNFNSINIVLEEFGYPIIQENLEIELEEAPIFYQTFDSEEVIYYESVLSSTRAIGYQILHVYQNIVRCKVNNSQTKVNKEELDNLQELLKKEQAIYKEIEDRFTFQNYLKSVYDFEKPLFPLKILGILPDYTSLHFLDQENGLVMNRILNYSEGMPDVLEEFISPLSDKNVLLQDQVSELKDLYDVESLFWLLVSGIIGDLGTEDLLHKLSNLNFEYSEFLDDAKNEYEKAVKEKIESTFLDLLCQNGYLDIAYYYMFTTPKQMEKCISRGFNLSYSSKFDKDDFDPRFYDSTLEQINNYVDVLLSQDLTDELSLKLVDFFIQSCESVLNEQDYFALMEKRNTSVRKLQQ